MSYITGKDIPSDLFCNVITQGKRRKNLRILIIELFYNLEKSCLCKKYVLLGKHNYIYSNLIVTLGSGHEWGGLVVRLYNRHPTESVNSWLLSMVPWFVRLYYHTMTVTIDGSSHAKEGNYCIRVCYKCPVSLWCLQTTRECNLKMK